MKNKATYITIGLSFIIAIVASIAGGFMFEDIYLQSDLVSNLESYIPSIKLAFYLEILNGICVLLIGLLFYQVLKAKTELRTSYLVVRVIEALFCFIAAAFVLVTLYVNTENYQAYLSLQNLRDVIMTYMVPIAFSGSGLLLYIIILKTKVLPRYIAYWGIIGVIGILVLNLFNINADYLFLFAFPIITNEFYIGGYMIYKGLTLKE